MSQCFAVYHSKFKSFWPSKIGSDYEFVKNLVNNNPLKLAKINKVLTSAIIFNRIYGEGKCIDI